MRVPTFCSSIQLNSHDMVNEIVSFTSTPVVWCTRPSHLTICSTWKRMPCHIVGITRSLQTMSIIVSPRISPPTDHMPDVERHRSYCATAARDCLVHCNLSRSCILVSISRTTCSPRSQRDDTGTRSETRKLFTTLGVESTTLDRGHLSLDSDCQQPFSSWIPEVYTIDCDHLTNILQVPSSSALSRHYPFVREMERP